MVLGHKIKEKISSEEFMELVAYYNDNDIYSTNHTFFNLDQKERKLFKHEMLIHIIKEKIPLFVGIQNNHLHTVFFDYSKNEAVRMVLEISPEKIEIVTFYIVEKITIPRM